ncbi:DUF1963 domain-containing protein [Roseibium sp. HPY-6]|uniref:DUF1963 domain-containing protein n=1 Tax=Roseibium sp. HPY-6 TaxID=3229852 RepID=UPI003390708D
MRPASPGFVVRADRIQEVLENTNNRTVRRVKKPAAEALYQQAAIQEPVTSPAVKAPAAARVPLPASNSHRTDVQDMPETVLETVSVVLRRQVPIRGDEAPRSWFGGLPMMPENVPWPTSISRDQPQKGEFPLHFLAQLSCADLPEDLWGGLGPRSGWLLFFFDPNSCEPESGGEGYRVIYTKTLGVERQAPADLGPVYDGTYSGPQYRHLEGVDAIPDTWRRWPVDFVTVPNRVIEDSGFARVTPEHFEETLYPGQEHCESERPPVPEPFTQQMILAVLTSIETRLGKHPLKPALPDTALDGLRDADVFQTLKIDTPDLKEKILALESSLQAFGDPDVEGTEIDDARDRLADLKDRLESGLRLTALMDRYPSADSLLDYQRDTGSANNRWREGALRDLRDMIDQVRSQDPDNAVSPHDWASIKTYLQETGTSFFNFFDLGQVRDPGSRYSALEKKVSLWDLYDPGYVQLWEFVADYHADPERRNLIPPETLRGFEPYWRRLCQNRPHRVGGEFDALQSSPRAGPTDRVLLLHLAGDVAMNWTWGDAGIVYFWISPQDLASGRFENTEAVLECY